MHNLNYPVWTALITPLLENGDIDFENLGTLIALQEQAGNALLILGSTGEALALNLEEKQAIIKYIGKQALKVPVMVGVGGFQLEEQIQWIKFCEQHAKVDAFLLVTPIYAKPGIIGQTKWFEALLDVSSKPCMLYNVPGRTAVKLIPEVLTHLKGHNNLWSLKEASGSLEDFKAFQMANLDVTMYSGDDGLVAEHVPLGAVGVVSVSSNAWPRATHRYITSCLAQKDPEFAGWVDACDALFLSSNPIPVKVLMHEKGLIKSTMLRLPLTADDFGLEKLKTLLAHDQAVSKWHKE